METSAFHTRRQLGTTGLTVSPLGFGAAPIGFLATDQARINHIVDELTDCGVNVIDTAALYEGSEEAIGKALADRRDHFVLVSKCGQEFPDLPGTEWSAEVIEATIDRSLRRLRTDRLDVMLLHSCDQEILQNGEAISALIAARDTGKLRFIGYSGDNSTAAAAASIPDFSVIETSVNLCDQSNIDVVLPITLAHGIGVIAKRPLANTAWRGPESLSGMYQNYARPYCERFQAMGLDGLEEESGLSWAEIALRFALFQPGVHVGIVGTTNPANVRRNAEAAARGPLPTPLNERIRHAFSHAEASSGGPWPGLT